MNDNYNIITIDGRVFETSRGAFTARLVQPPSVTANSTNIAHLIDFVGNNQTRRACLWIPGEEEALDPTLATLQPRVDNAIRDWIESPAFDSKEHNFILLDGKFVPYNPQV